MESPMSEFQEIDVHRVKEMLDSQSANIVDIRDPQSYAGGHVPNSVRLNDENIDEFVQDADKEKPLVVYCYHGISSRDAAAYLFHQGFSQVYSMTGGFAAWGSAYPSEK